MRTRTLKIVYLIFHLPRLSCSRTFTNPFISTPVTNINDITSDPFESTPVTNSNGITSATSSAFNAAYPASTARILGAAVGGAFLVSFVTSILFICLPRRFLKICRKSANDNNKIIQQGHGCHKGNQEQINIKSVEYDVSADISQTTARTAPIQKCKESAATKDSVYNHLNESDKADRSDYYDHAGPSPSMSLIEDGYGVVSITNGSKSNGDYNTVDQKNNGNEQNDTYFTLRVQEV